MSKQLDAQLNDANAKLDQAQVDIQELTVSEATNLGRKHEEAESQLNQFNKRKQELAKSLEEAKAPSKRNVTFAPRRRERDATSRPNSTLFASCKRNRVEEQIFRVSSPRRTRRLATWKQKCESEEGGVSSEALEDLKRKLGAMLADTEPQIEATLAKSTGLDKSNNRLCGELEDVSLELERVS